MGCTFSADERGCNMVWRYENEFQTLMDGRINQKDWQCKKVVIGDDADTGQRFYHGCCDEDGHEGKHECGHGLKWWYVPCEDENDHDWPLFYEGPFVLVYGDSRLDHPPGTQYHDRVANWKEPVKVA